MTEKKKEETTAEFIKMPLNDSMYYLRLQLKIAFIINESAKHPAKSGL